MPQLILGDDKITPIKCAIVISSDRQAIRRNGAHARVATCGRRSHGGAGDPTVGKSKALAKKPDYWRLEQVHQLDDLGLLIMEIIIGLM